MNFLDFAPILDADPRVKQGRLLLIAAAHKMHRPKDDLSFLLMSYQDFLLRMPAMLEKMLVTERSGRNVNRLDIEHFERSSIEARSLPLRFEPWSDDYRLTVASLVSQKLLHVVIEGRPEWTVQTTERGTAIANELSESPAFGVIYRRAEIIAKTLAIKVATLRTYVGRTAPETVTLERAAV